MVLDGLEEAIYKVLTLVFRKHDGCRRNYHKIHFVRYADDFIVTGATEEVLMNIVKPVIVNFLSERGLTLSETKTKITNVYNGFDFLGQNIRKFSNGKLLIRPSKDNFKSVLSKIKQLIRKHWGAPTVILIRRLNSVITGWTNYHKHIASANTLWTSTGLYGSTSGNGLNEDMPRKANTGSPTNILKWLATVNGTSLALLIMVQRSYLNMPLIPISNDMSLSMVKLTHKGEQRTRYGAPRS